MKKFKWVSIILILAVILGACSDKKTEESSPEDMGELLPELSLLTQLPENNSSAYEGATDLGNALKEIGVEATVEPIDFNVLVDRLYGDDVSSVDMWTLGWSGRAERVDPDVFIHSLFHSSNARPGSNNLTGFINDEFDALADAQRTEVDPDKRQEIVYEAQELLAEEIPLITLYVEEFSHAYNNERFDNMTIMPGEGIFNEWMPVEAEPLTDDKILRIAALQDLDTVNPVGAIGVYEWRNLRLIYDKLTRLTTESDIAPAAAKEWEYLDDTTLKVTLREGMTFHDGEPVTVEDVKFSYEYFIDNEIAYFLSYVEPIESIDIEDENTLVFNLKQPYGPFVNVTMTQMPILPMHIWENIVEEEGLDHPDQYLNEELIGSGPFIFDGWKRGEYFRTKKFDDFYEDIAIDGYSYDLFANDEAVMTALETGTADVNAEQFIAANIERAGGMDHLTLQSAPDIGFHYLGFNQRKAPFNDKAFKKALTHMIDYDTILDVYLDGHGLKGMHGPGLSINSANEFWHNPNFESPEFNPELAREILEEAGYTWDSDGRLHVPVGMELE